MSAYQDQSVRDPASLARPPAAKPRRREPPVAEDAIAPHRARPAEIRIGTSGWHYAAWRGPFYPEDIKQKDLLAFYVTRFSTTELNNSFYRLPNESTVKAWHDKTPEGFLFAWKASRLITHLKRLKEVEENVAFMFGRMAGLSEKSGPVLFQLPPSLRADRDRLAAFLALLPPGGHYTFEFRHPSWYEPPILDLLREFDVSLCFSDHAAAPAPWIVTSSSHVYIRAHGPSGRYWGSYSDETLAEWAALIAGWHREGCTAYAYFDNDVKSAAPTDARRLLDRVDADGARASAPS